MDRPIFASFPASHWISSQRPATPSLLQARLLHEPQPVKRKNNFEASHLDCRCTRMGVGTAYAETPQVQRQITSAANKILQESTFLYATKGEHRLELDRILDSSVNVAGKRPVIIYSLSGGWEAGEPRL